MNLLILSSSTGGGHEMRANALKSWWTEGKGEARILRPLEDGFKLYRWGSSFYNLIQRNFPLFHYLYFYFLEYASLHRGPRRIIGSKKFLRDAKDFSPDLVLSVHAHLNHGYFQLIRDSLPAKKAKFVIFCGELDDGHGFSRHWINPAADLFAGPFEETCQAAVRRGMPEQKTMVTGPLLRKPFYEKASQGERENFLKKYGLSNSLKTYVLGTGANGVNRHREVIDAFNRSDDRCQVLALCGKNEVTLTELKGIKDRSKVPFVALPELSAADMALVLRNADCLFARPGAGMTTEAIACGTPVVFDLSRGVMPQETNNLNFWKKRAANLMTTTRPSRLPELVTRRIPFIQVKMEKKPGKLLDALDGLVRG
jgi:processive 1,2-diacylglycerol beta-glucosyltransferase